MRHALGIFGLMFLVTLATAFGFTDLDQIKSQIEEGKDLEQARDWLLEKLAKDEKNPEYLLPLQEACFKLGDNENGVTYGRVAKEVLLEYPQVRFYLASALAGKMGSNPMSWMTGKGEYIELLETAIAMDPTYTPPYQALIGFYVNAPPIAGGSTAKAGELADQLAKHDPRQGTMLKANILEREGKHEEALPLLKELFDAEPDNEIAIFRYALSLQSNKHYDQAMALFKKNTDRDPPHLPSLYQQARTRIFMETEYEQAIEVLDRYIALCDEKTQPSKAAAWWRKAQAYKGLEKWPEMLECLETSIALDGNFPESQKDLKWLKRKMKE